MSNSEKQPENDRTNLGIIRDPNVKIEVGRTFHNNYSITWDKELADKNILSISEVRDLYKRLRSENSTSRPKVYLHELLAGSKLVVPNLEIPKRNPELEKRITFLKNSLAEKEYQRMTQNVNFSSRFSPDDSVGFQMKQMNTGLIAVLQFVISLACAFFFGFTGVELFIGTLQLPVKLLLGIAIALIVGAAELYFLAVNLAVSEEVMNNTTTFQPKVSNSNSSSSLFAKGSHLKTS